ETAPPHIQRVIVLGSQFGMRVGPSELFSLKWEDVDIDGQVIHVKAADKNENEPWRDVPIKESLLPVFRSWREEDMQKGCEYVVNYHNKGISNLRYGWAGTKERAGITRRIRPYDLRHAFATEAIAAGADYGTVAKLMGHSSAQMVLQFYQHVMTEQKKRAIEILPDIDDSLLKCAQKNVPTFSAGMIQ
ncbi:MAG: tyrosine-type recombinase/integrase, partial [Desulfovibrio sp.]